VTSFVEEEELERELPALKAERHALRAELVGCDNPPNIVRLHPAAVARYLAAIDKLEQPVRDGELYGAEAKRAVRDLISTVTVQTVLAGTAPEIEATGHLTKLIGGEHFPSRDIAGGRVVAGEGLEPPTRGL